MTVEGLALSGGCGFYVKNELVSGAWCHTERGWHSRGSQPPPARVLGTPTSSSSVTLCTAGLRRTSPYKATARAGHAHGPLKRPWLVLDGGVHGGHTSAGRVRGSSLAFSALRPPRHRSWDSYGTEVGREHRLPGGCPEGARCAPPTADRAEGTSCPGRALHSETQGAYRAPRPELEPCGT